MVSRDQLDTLLHELVREIDDPRAGIHGPGSTSWQIGKEWGLFLAGGRAALMQLAHPFVAHAIEQHSATRDDPVGRFRRTFDHVFAMVFGDLDEAVRSARRVHAVHSRIVGTIDEDVGSYRAGTAYAANDERSLLWVHATLLDSAVTAYELLMRPLSLEQKDRYVAESVRFAKLFGISPDRVPLDWQSFSAYMNRMIGSGEIAVGRPARQIATFLFSPPSPLHRVTHAWARLLTTGMLPEGVRAGYGLGFGPKEQQAFRASVRLLRAVYPRLPRRLRYAPAYVQARRRLAGKPGVDRVGVLLETLWLRSLGAPRRDPSGRSWRPRSDSRPPGAR